MKTLIAVAHFIGGLLKKKTNTNAQSGNGPYADINAEDGSSWQIYKRAGKKYDY